MIIQSYKLKKNLTGRIATQFTWGLSAIPHQVFLKTSESRIVNAQSLIGLLSGQFKEGELVEIAVQTLEESLQVNKVILDLDLATPIN